MQGKGILNSSDEHSDEIKTGACSECLQERKNALVDSMIYYFTESMCKGKILDALLKSWSDKYQSYQQDYEDSYIDLIIIVKDFRVAFREVFICFIWK